MNYLEIISHAIKESTIIRRPFQGTRTYSYVTRREGCLWHSNSPNSSAPYLRGRYSDEEQGKALYAKGSVLNRT